MPDFKIGSFRIAKGAPKDKEEVVYFATLPFAGSMARVGSKGLFEIIAAIEKQYADHQLANDLTLLRDWMMKLSAATRLFEQVRIDIEENSWRQVLVIDALDEEQKRVIKDKQDLELFLLDRAALDNRERPAVDAENVETVQINATPRTPGI